MRIEFLHEPELQFGAGGQHIDIRFGLLHNGPLDLGTGRAPAEIKVGIVGTSETVEGMARWLERCRKEVPAKKSKQPNLFPMFPGFSRDRFGSELVIDRELQAIIAHRDIVAVLSGGRSAETVEGAVSLFLENCKHLVDKARPDVLVCAPPGDLREILEADQAARADDARSSVARVNGASSRTGKAAHGNDMVNEALPQESALSEEDADETGPAAEESVEETPAAIAPFHDLLKARGMSLGTPIQMVWPETYDPQRRRKQKGHPDRIRQLQDEATRAWNLHLALYYKAGGTPWRLLRDPAEYSTCYVGISFYRTSDDEYLMTSMAQVFNELGQGVIVRGGHVRVSKRDRRPHLDTDAAKSLLQTALAVYRREHGTLPARIVVHKTSGFNADELVGFRAAADADRVDRLDLLSLRHSSTRLFRIGDYPPLRGTLVELDERTHLLYTRGSVDFFAAYPGMYVPRPLEFLCEDIEQTPRFLAAEMLGLSKMNWNNTQFDGADPITTRAADQVGSILRYVPDNAIPQARYAFYV